jgi:hypothetical protein
MEPGYNPITRLYYVNTGIENIPMNKSLHEAVEFIERELFYDFPFESEADKATAYASLLQGFLHPYINGSHPVLDFEAPAHGNGKTLLCEITSIPAHGENYQLTPLPKEDDEVRKKLMSTLRAGVGRLVFDNVNSLDSAVIASAVTTRRISDRLLGKTENISYLVNCEIVYTATNPSISDEMARRNIRCRLASTQERPWNEPPFGTVT